MKQTATRTLGLTVNPAAGPTYYVSPSGSDAAAGSAAAPWKTLQASLPKLPSGSTLVLRAGNYAGFVAGWDSQAASTGDVYGTISGVTFQADPQAAPGSIIINAPNNKTRVAVDLEPGCNTITLRGIKVAGSIAPYPNKGSGMKVCGSNCQVLDCTIAATIYGFGLMATEASNLLVQGCSISGVGNGGNADYGHGIYVADNTTGTILRSNTIFNNAYIGIHLNGDLEDSGAPPGLVQNAQILANLIYGNGQNGINGDGVQGALIANNLIYSFANYGICLYQSDAGGPSKNNTIVNNTVVSALVNAGAALRLLNAATGNTVLNNILLGGDGNAYRIAADSLAGLVSDYNAGSSKYQSDDTGSAMTWSLDRHSVAALAAQLFVDSAGGNYQLSTTSPALGTGTATLAQPTDLLGNPRPVNGRYDIGCYSD